MSTLTSMCYTTTEHKTASNLIKPEAVTAPWCSGANMWRTMVLTRTASLSKACGHFQTECGVYEPVLGVSIDTACINVTGGFRSWQMHKT